MDLTSDDILGKEAVDPEGEILGVVMKLHLDRQSNSILGITVDQGIWSPDLFIGINFIEKFGVDAVFLNKIPISKYKGIQVYTNDGVSLGNVSEVILDNEKIHSFSVTVSDKDSRSPFKKKQLIILKNEIAEIGYSIILKKNFQIPKR